MSPGAADAVAGAGPGGVHRPEEPEAQRRNLLTVALGEARFGLWVDEVLEIVRTPPITRLPLAAGEVAGVASVRGVIVPVLDLGLRLLDAPAQRPGRLVLVRHRATGTIVGLLVDGVGTLLAVADEDLRPAPPEAEAQLPPDVVTGVVAADDAVITVLHLGKAVAPPETSTEE